MLFCEYMHLGIASGNNWLIVHLKNGGKLESELMKKQPDLERTMTRMYLDGIRIHKTTCALVDS